MAGGEAGGGSVILKIFKFSAIAGVLVILLLVTVVAAPFLSWSEMDDFHKAF